MTLNILLYGTLPDERTLKYVACWMTYPILNI